MRKKLLSFFLVVLLVISSVNCMITFALPSSADIVDPANWKATIGGITFSEASDGYNGSKGVTASGNIAWRDSFVKFMLEPNTAYSFSFAYKGAAAILNMHIFAVSDSSYAGGNHICNQFNYGATTCLSRKMTDYTFTADSWTKITAEFKTNSATEYYLVFDHGAGAGFTVSDFIFKKLTSEEELSVATNWKSTATGITFSAATESYKGGKGVTTLGNVAWRDSFVKFSLEPNTEYSLSFAYKGAAAISNMHIFAVSDSDYTSGAHICNQLKSGRDTCLSRKLTDYTFGVESWTNITADFKTNSATEYYLVFDHGAGAGFTVSDFSLQKNEGGYTPDDVEPTPEENVESDILKNKTYKDWQIVSRGAIKSPLKTYRTGATDGMTVEKMRYRSIYTAVNLDADKTYILTFYYSSEDREATDLESAKNGVQVIEKAGATDNGEVVLCKDGYSNLVTGFEISESERSGWQKVTAKIVTENAGEHILALTAKSLLGVDVNMHISDFNLIQYVRPFDKNNVIKYHTSKDWFITSRGSILKSTEVATEGDTTAFAVSKMRWRTVYTKVELEGGITYKLSFKYKDSSDTNVNSLIIAEQDGVILREGQFQLSLQPGYINYAVKPSLNKPSEVEGWKLASCIFTPEKAGTYTLGINAGGDSDDTDVLFSDFELLRYFDPATDVYIDIKTTNGGTATKVGKLPYKRGEEVSITAIPNEGNTFDGWFDTAGNKVFSDAAYSFTADTEIELIAKFSGGNMPYVDWMELNDMDGTFENGSMPGWYAVFKSTGVVANWATFNPSTYVAHNGKKSMQIIARHQHAYFTFDNLSKNSDYYLSFYIYCADKDLYNEKTEQGFKMNEISMSVGHNTYWIKRGEFSEGGGGWHRVELFFNTGNMENATICINYYGDENLEEKAVYLDDVTFVQYFADELDNGDFEQGKLHWIGEYSVSNEDSNSIAILNKGKKLYQSVDVEEHSLYTVSFRAKGNLLATASKINKYSTDVFSILNSTTSVTTNGDWNEYSYKVYSGVNGAINLVFEALADDAMLDDIVIIKEAESAGGIVENIDFESERFEIRHSNTDAYEIFNGGEGSEFVRSGSKSLRFNAGAATASTDYLFEEAYMDFQISNKRTYKLTFYYKTQKGNTLKISPDYLGLYSGGVNIEQTAVNDGWNRVAFYVSSPSAHYFKPLISNILGKTKSDFYVDDISYTVISSVVLETNIKNTFAEPPLALLNNEGFEAPITESDWGKLPSTMKVISGDTEFGSKYIRVNPKTFYVLPASVEAGVQYYFSASLRGTGGYLGLSTTADGKGLFAGTTDKIESFLKPIGTKWNRSGIRFTAPTSGTIYLVFDVANGYLEADNILIYKEQYALDKKPKGHEDVIYGTHPVKKYIFNGGYDSYGNVLWDGSPAMGDTFPVLAVVLTTLAAALVLLFSYKKKETE